MAERDHHGLRHIFLWKLSGPWLRIFEIKILMGPPSLWSSGLSNRTTDLLEQGLCQVLEDVKIGRLQSPPALSDLLSRSSGHVPWNSGWIGEGTGELLLNWCSLCFFTAYPVHGLQSRFVKGSDSDSVIWFGNG